MFVRKKKNESEKICVQVVDKSSGKYRVVHTVGSSADKTQIAGYVKAAKIWITNKECTLEIDFSNVEAVFESFMDSITSVKREGDDLLLGRLFDQIGFNQIEDYLFRELVIARVAYPKSKLTTTEYLSVLNKSAMMKIKFTGIWISFIRLRKSWYNKSVMNIP